MKVKTKYGVLEDNLIVKKLLKTEPMNIDEQIRKSISIDEIEINQYVTDEIISQIKQSILKAIMKKLPKTIGKWQDFSGVRTASPQTIENKRRGYNKAIKEFESVIKEILGENK